MLRGLTQERLAERLECSPQFISDMERGVVGISLSTLKKLCLTLGVSSDSILFGTESETVLNALTDRCRVLSKEQFSILVEIVEMTNEQYKGSFTEADKT